MDYYYTIGMERAFSTSLHVNFGVSLVLHCLSFYCLIRETPPNQREVRAYLLFIQIAISMHDLIFDVLVQPIPLMPVPAAYFLGVLARIGVPVNIMLAPIVSVGALIAIGFVLCFVYKHQTIMEASSRFKMSRTKFRLLSGSCFSMALFLFVAVLATPHDLAISDQAMDSYPFNLTWIRERPPYVVMEKSTLSRAGSILLLVNTTNAFIAVISLYCHILYVLNSMKSKRSIATKNMIKRSVTTLFVQLFVPAFFLCSPLLIFFFFLATDTGDFMTCYALMYLTLLHSPLHSIILISTTPAYRKFIFSFFLKCKKRIEPQIRVSSAIGHSFTSNLSGQERSISRNQS